MDEELKMDNAENKNAENKNANCNINTGALLAASCIFGAIFTALMYDNWASIMTFVVMCVASGFGIVVLLKQGHSLKPGFIFADICVLLMSLNIGISDDGALVFFDYCGIFVMLLLGLVHQLNDDKAWKFSNYFKSANVFFGHCFVHMIDPIADIISNKEKKEEKSSKTKYVIIGLAIGFPIILIIVLLLASADAVFGELANDIFDSIFSPDLFGITFMVLNGLFISYAVCKAACCHKKRDEIVKDGSFEPIVAITIGVILSVIYLIFSIIQIAYVFIGNMKLPEGYTYAEYVHQGFEQLVVVCIINLILVFMGRGLFKRSKLLNGILMLISGCTLIMVASCAVRIKMYIDVYHMTVLRLLVIWALVIITIVIFGAMVYIFSDRFPLFRYCVAVTAIWFICLGFSRPEYCVAKYNMEKARTCSDVDYHYVCGSLGRDAAPAIYDAVTNHYDEIIKNEVTGENWYNLTYWAKRYFHLESDSDQYENPGIREYNVSYYKYIELAKKMRFDF